MTIQAERHPVQQGVGHGAPDIVDVHVVGQHALRCLARLSWMASLRLGPESVQIAGGSPDAGLAVSGEHYRPDALGE